jgi:hypothetical protein
MTDQRKKKRPKRILWIGVIGFILVLGLLSISFLIEKESDPIRVEIIDNDTKSGKVLYKITHLKDGRIDYVFNFSENMGTRSFDSYP